MGMCQVAWRRVSDAVLRCHKNVLSQDRRWAMLVGSPSETSLSTKALLGRISDVSSTVLTFSALTQKQNSFPWSMLYAECTHPSLLSFFLLFLFSYWSLPPQESLWDVGVIVWSWKIQWHFCIPEGILSNLQMLKKDDTFQNQLVFWFRLWHIHWR